MPHQAGAADLLGRALDPGQCLQAAVHDACQDFIEVIHLFLIEGHQAIQVFGREAGILGFRHTEKFRVIRRHVLHIILQTVQNTGLLFVNIAKKTCFIIVDLDGTGRRHLVLFGGVDQLLSRMLRRPRRQLRLNLVGLDEIGQASQASEMSFSVQADDGKLEYSGSSLNGLFAQRRNIVRLPFYRMIRDILRFNKTALPGIDHLDDEDDTVAPLFGAGSDSHAARVGEFDGVAHQVGQDLPQLGGV